MIEWVWDNQTLLDLGWLADMRAFEAANEMERMKNMEAKTKRGG